MPKPWQRRMSAHDSARNQYRHGWRWSHLSMLFDVGVPRPPRAARLRSESNVTSVVVHDISHVHHRPMDCPRSSRTAERVAFRAPDSPSCCSDGKQPQPLTSILGSLSGHLPGAQTSRAREPRDRADRNLLRAVDETECSLWWCLQPRRGRAYTPIAC